MNLRLVSRLLAACAVTAGMVALFVSQPPSASAQARSPSETPARRARPQSQGPRSPVPRRDSETPERRARPPRGRPTPEPRPPASGSPNPFNSGVTDLQQEIDPDTNWEAVCGGTTSEAALRSAHSLHQEGLVDETIEQLNRATSCAKMEGDHTLAAEIDKFITALNNGFSNWPDSIPTGFTASSGNQTPAFSVPNIISALGGLIETATQAAANQSSPPIAQSQPAPTISPSLPPVDQLLAQWGWKRVSCWPGAVFIAGLGTDTVCVEPNSNLPAGQYQYNPTTNQLTAISAVPVNSGADQNSIPPPTVNPAGQPGL